MGWYLLNRWVSKSDTVWLQGARCHQLEYGSTKRTVHEHTRTAVGERLKEREHNSHVFGYYFLLSNVIVELWYYIQYVLESPGFVRICMKLFFLPTSCHEVLSKPSISAEKLQSLVEAFENTGGDAAGVRYLCLGRPGSFTVFNCRYCREISGWKEAQASRREVTIQL